MAVISGAVELTKMLGHYRTKGENSARLGGLSSQINGRLLLLAAPLALGLRDDGGRACPGRYRVLRIVTKP